ncbi:MAG: glycosyltransferase [Ruminococcus flavefaciens]|nr:glycosyltransferase [Ruminococcus flavefaciens]
MGELISVIIPCFNVEKYIDRCMESVLNQTYRNLEIILVDDGSTDSTGEICERYSQTDTRVKVVHKKNGGLSSARNKGLEVALGTYIGFVDSDDWIEPDFYSYLYDLITRYQSDIAQCAYFLTDGNELRPVIVEEIKKVSRDELMDFFFRAKGEVSNYSVWNRLYKHEVVKGITFPNGYVNEDVYYSYFIFLKTHSAVISNQPKYNYYINENGITRGALRKQDLSLYYVWDKVLEDTKRHNRQYYEKALLNRKRAVFTLFSKYVIYGIQDNDTFTEQWFEEQLLELRKAYKELLRSGVLDLKRKIVLTFLCISPRLLRFIYTKRFLA